MAELNFGLLNPPGSQSIGNAFVTGMDQARASQMQDMQMQRGQRQDQMAELQLRKAQATETKLNQFYESIAANGGPTTPIEIEDKMIGSGIPDVSQKGLLARSARLQVEEGRKLFGEAMNAGAPPPPAAAAPPPVAAPGDFLAAGNQFMPPMGAVNNMPGAASAPAVNNMPGASAQPDVATLRTRQNRLLALGTPESLAAARELGRQISDASKPEQFMNVPGVGAINPRTREVIMPAVAPAVADPTTVAEYNFAKSPAGGGFPGTYNEFLVARARAGRTPPQPRAEAAPRTQQVTLSDGSLGIVNMDTGVITPSTLAGAGVKGKPSAFAEKTAAQRAQLGNDLDFAISQLTDITKDGGLIDQSTGSGAGRLIDLAAGFGGKATPGAIAIGKIAPIADLVIKMVPRFEGPQSDKDTALYKQAAGQVAEPTLPTEIRKAAGKEVLRIMTARKNQFATADMAAEGAPPAAALSLQEQAAAELARRASKPR